MTPNQIAKGSLVLYKVRPAVITDIGEKITIQLEGKKVKRVRSKDIALLHPGPVTDLDRLACCETDADTDEAWELLEGETSSLAELCELVFDDYTAEKAWSLWQHVAQGVYFEGSPEKILRRSRQQVDEDLEKISLREKQESEKLQFIENVSNATLDDNDRKKLAEVEMVALGASQKSNILRMLDIKQTPESAHQFLINCGYWDKEFNPFPHRTGIDLNQPQFDVNELSDYPREDLTYMESFAIDDADSTDPDDAISLHDNVFWVHVADVAALVAHDSAIDTQASQSASNLYLPEGLIHMLPESLTLRLGLGLQEISPALSIGFKLSEQADISDIRILPSWIRATRLSYSQADLQMDSRFAEIARLCNFFKQKRLSNNAAQIDLPEASVRIKQGEIEIRPLEKLASRHMVADAMLMAGYATAVFCRENKIPIPYAGQPTPEEIWMPVKPSEMYAYRRLFKASNTSLEPEPHFGLGLELYTRVTSPLRRYLDLVVHQQLRAFLSGQPILSKDQLSQKILSVDQRSATVRRTERLSNMHWKLVYLQRNPKWEGEATIVQIDARKTAIIIPELALETKIRTRESFTLDDTIRIRISSVDLPGQTAFFQCVS